MKLNNRIRSAAIPYLSLSYSLLIPFALFTSSTIAETSGDGGGSDPSPPAPSSTDPPCTITSSSTGSFFDLRGLTVHPSTNAKDTPATDFLSNGHDYGANFTINICAPVVADTSHAEGISEDLKQNISAFYTPPDSGKIYSIGMASSELKLRGRKLVLEYKDGSPCPRDKELRKSTIMSLLCDREFVTKPSLSFVGQANDCVYFFEVRTSYACPTFKKQESLGPISIFAIIGLVFAIVYLVGGCVYQRTVMRARGWKQIPHYHTWVNFFTLMSDVLSFLLTSLTRLCPCLRRESRSGISASSNGSRGGTSYMRNGFGSTGAFGRRNVGLLGGDAGSQDGPFDVEDENRILDQLDEEWGDD